LAIDTRYAQEVPLDGLRLFPVSKIVVTSIYIGPKRFLTRFKRSLRSKKRNAYVQTPSVTYYQRLNHLLDVHEILRRSSSQEIVGQALVFQKLDQSHPA